jgi:hypothetical protein
MQEAVKAMTPAQRAAVEAEERRQKQIQAAIDADDHRVQWEEQYRKDREAKQAAMNQRIRKQREQEKAKRQAETDATLLAIEVESWLTTATPEERDRIMKTNPPNGVEAMQRLEDLRAGRVLWGEVNWQSAVVGKRR